jgi:cytidylate kinase
VPLIVAIDGPSGSGKSSTSRGVAQRLGLRYVDTGAMYRAMSWWMLENDVDIDDAEAIADVCERPRIRLEIDPLDPRVFVDGRDVSAAIREDAVASAVSKVAAVPQVRSLLVRQQREIVSRCLADDVGVVMEGRDIGSVVLPDADLKVYLTADPQARAERRALERQSDGDTSYDVSSAAANLADRDRRDTTRATSPLQAPDDAVHIDGTHLSLDDVIGEVVAHLARESQ